MLDQARARHVTSRHDSHNTSCLSCRDVVTSGSKWNLGLRVLVANYKSRLSPVLSNAYRVAQKISHYQIIKKIILKPASEIRFIRQIKVSIQYYKNYPLVLNILCVTYFVTSITLPEPQNCICIICSK